MSNTQTAATTEGTMITENAWAVRKHQGLTRAPCAQRTWQQLATGLPVGSRDLCNAGRA